MLTTPSPYYDNKDLIDFLSINNSKTQNPVLNDTITFTGIKAIKTPSQLTSVVTSGMTYGSDVYDIKLYINGVRVLQSTKFTVVISATSIVVTFLPVGIGYNVISTDEIAITGKFIDV